MRADLTRPQPPSPSGMSRSPQDALRLWGPLIHLAGTRLWCLLRFFCIAGPLQYHLLLGSRKKASFCASPYLLQGWLRLALGLP